MYKKVLVFLLLLRMNKLYWIETVQNGPPQYICFWVDKLSVIADHGFTKDPTGNIHAMYVFSRDIRLKMATISVHTSFSMGSYGQLSKFDFFLLIRK